MSKLTPFAFDDSLVRVVIDAKGNPWFVAKDVCRVLEISDHHQAVDALDGDERGRYTVPTPSGEQEMLTVSESGLYSLVFRSRKPEAKRFRKWVTSEVLPSLRKSGTYAMPSAPRPVMAFAVRRMRPVLRERVLNSAVQAAKMAGTVNPYEIEAIYARFCELVTDGQADIAGLPVALASRWPHVVRFATECCTPMPGNTLTAREVWQAFREWLQEEGGRLALPSRTVFGRIFSGYYPEKQRGHTVVYHNVALR